MKMKTKKKMMVILLVLAIIFSTMTGCSVKKAEVQENVVRIRVYDAGYGIDHLNAIISEFEKTYADKGYKIVIDKANKNFDAATVLQEMSVGFEKNKIDMYYVNNITSEAAIDEMVEDEDLKVLEISDVFSSTAINSDGSETEETLKDRLLPGVWEMMQTDLSYVKTQKSEFAEYEGKNYVTPFYSQFSGFVMNTDKLSQAGLEVPKTTNELLDCIDAINEKREGGTSGFSNTYPISWSGGEAYNYWRTVYDVWFSQYEGVDTFNEFVTLSSYADDLTKAYQLYEKEGWREVYNLMEVLLDDSNAPADTLTMDAVSAQDRLLVGKAVFSPCGTWLKSEMGAEYLEDMKNCQMMKVPVLSAIGVKLGLDGKKGADEKLCDKVLSALVGLVDEGKTVDEIIATIKDTLGVALKTEQVEAVQEARGMYGELTRCGWIVAGDSPSTEICKLFLRFLASDYSIGVMADLSSVVSAFSKGYEFEENGHPFDDSMFRIYNQGLTCPVVRQLSYTTVRQANEFTLFDNFEWESSFGRLVSSGTLTGEKFYQQQIDYAKGFTPKPKE